MSLNRLSLLYLIPEKEIFVNTLNVVRIIIIIFNCHFKIFASCIISEIISLSFFSIALLFYVDRTWRYCNALSLAIRTVYNALKFQGESGLKRTNHSRNFCDSADPLVDTDSAEYRFSLSLSLFLGLVISKEKRRAAESVKPCTGSLRLQGTKVVNDLTVGKELLREGAEKTPRAVSYTIDIGLDSPFVQKPRRSLRYARQERRYTLEFPQRKVIPRRPPVNPGRNCNGLPAASMLEIPEDSSTFLNCALPVIFNGSILIF